jgi:hypothetical protein
MGKKRTNCGTISPLKFFHKYFIIVIGIVIVKFTFRYFYVNYSWYQLIIQNENTKINLLRRKEEIKGKRAEKIIILKSSRP